MKNKKLFMTKMYMYVTFGFMTEIIATAIGGSNVGLKDWHYMTLMGNISLHMIFVYLFAFPILNKFNDSDWACNKPMWLQTLIGGFIIGLIEFTAGVVLNIIFGFNCWNYTDEFMNLFGQICLKNYLLFSLAYPLSIYLIDHTEWILLRDREELCYGVLKNYKKLITGK